MVINIIFKIIFFLIYFYPTIIYSSQIYDYQTEKFIEKLNSKILSVNDYSKNINFVIINDNFPNAFINQDNILFISSGLLIHSPDYISLLAVLAHEIGHLERYHVVKRIKEIDGLKNKNSLGNLAAVAGSMLIKQPELLNSIILNQTAINKLYINFTQEQEIEADIYSIETLNALNLPTNSIKKFLKILEKQTQSDSIDIEIKKFSTHPLFSERYEIIDSKENLETSNFEKKLDKEFKFIQSKFIAYTDNSPHNLKNERLTYYQAIQFSKTGNLFESLKKINLLIAKNEKDIFLIETKADILLSYGYNQEAIKFYKKVLEEQPLNIYVKYNIFTNLNFHKKKPLLNKNILLSNIDLIKFFPNNKILLSKFYNLSKLLNKKEWILCFEILLFNKDNLKKDLMKLKKETKDSNLKKIIKLYT